MYVILKTVMLTYTHEEGVSEMGQARNRKKAGTFPAKTIIIPDSNGSAVAIEVSDYDFNSFVNQTEKYITIEGVKLLKPAPADPDGKWAYGHPVKGTMYETSDIEVAAAIEYVSGMVVAKLMKISIPPKELADAKKLLAFLYKRDNAAYKWL